MTFHNSALARLVPDGTPRYDRVVQALRAFLLLAGLAHCAVAGCAPRVANAGFWFEEVTYESPGLGRLTPADLQAIEAIARAELTTAFSGMRFVLSQQTDATYRVRVVQRLLDNRFRRPVEVAGQSLGMTGLGGQGAVSFSFLASSAIAYAPADATRAATIEAIGRGVGRAAVHEFTHQILPRAAIHSPNVRSYEYASAARPEQYFGDMQWDLALPLLRQRIGS
jgi:hypothetical protein